MTPASPKPTDILEWREWDSRFFGRRIARLKVNRLSAQILNVVEAWCDEQNIECLYFLADPNDSETARLAREHGFEFVDARVTLTKELPETFPVERGRLVEGIRSATAGDLPALREMARRLHYDSRFFFDARFDRELSGRMFEKWIENCVAAPQGCVFVAEVEGRLAGYIGCRRTSAEDGQVELLGVDEFAQGKGVGGKLISAAQNWFAGQAIRQLSVVTQGRNVRAQRAYQRGGFVTRAFELWYHRWFTSVLPPLAS